VGASWSVDVWVWLGELWGEPGLPPAEPLRFLVVGKLGSHLTRAAFVLRLPLRVEGVVVRLLVVAVLVVLMGRRWLSRAA